MTDAPQARAPPGPPDPHTERAEFVASASDHLLVETHEETHLLRRPAPVLGGERVRRHRGDPDLDGTVQHVKQRGFARPMPLGSRQSALPGPASVAVHDEGDVSGQELGRDALAGARPMGEAADRATARHYPGGPARSSTKSPRHGIPCPRGRRRDQRSTSGRDRSPRSRCHCR